MFSLTTFMAVVGIAALASSLTIDPDSVSLSTRKYWCQEQTSSCPLICLQMANTTSSPESNTCDASTLEYSCVCSNGISPNETEYSLTIPYFICTEYDNQCVTACGSDSSCAAACRDDNPCGAQDPVRVNTTTASTMTATASETGKASQTVYSGFAGSSASAGSAPTVKAAINFGQAYGLLITLGGLFAGFAILL
ncbi:MAG: hypothetical protein M1834_007191 [Cirrosporium novae-zelandiae]|nr:MAG: hypothetical protein M1834_007191 [Cirrosporium novae-zelandiae]